jgi:hypothetical protein
MQTHLKYILLFKIDTGEKIASVVFKVRRYLYVYLSKCMELVSVDYYKGMPDIQHSAF